MRKLFLPIFLIVLLLPFFPAAAAEGEVITDAELLPAQAQAVLDSGTFVQGILQDDYLYILTEDAEGFRYVTILKQDGTGFQPDCASPALPAMDGIRPTIAVTEETLSICYGEELAYLFTLNYYGGWNLAAVSSSESYRCTRRRLIDVGSDPSRTIAGNGTSQTLNRFDPTQVPATFILAAEALTTDNYALVNNPDPADRLHLRAAASKDAVSKGMYYNGTPVYVNEDLGDWVKVTVANDDGYMMKRYLAFGTDMLGVQAAFPGLCIRESLAGKDVTVYMRPNTDSGAAGVLPDRGAGRVEITIIGAIGDNWYHVICGNGLIGYIPASAFASGGN